MTIYTLPAFLLRPGGRPQQPLRLEAGGPAPLALQARGHGRHPNALIPGFVPSASSGASGVVVTAFYPPPEVPPTFTGRHVFALTREQLLQQSRAGLAGKRLGPVPHIHAVARSPTHIRLR